MRWGYLIPRLIIVGIIWAFMAFGFDPLLRYSARESLQAMIGAKADIHQVETGFFPPVATVDKVALASAKKPGTNLMEFDRMSLRMAGAPLLRRCYVVDEAIVTGVRFGTSRDDNGQLEIDPDEEPSGPMIPPWMQERLQNMGDEWLEEFTQQAKAQVDPNRLETWRVGNEVYAKWDSRMNTIEIRIQTTKQQLDSLERQIKEAKNGDPVAQVQKYLQAAQDADLLIRDSRAFYTDMKASVPQEVARDFARLDQAQQNDREMVADSIRLLKPDSRRITESLLGEQLYLQLQQMLSWVEAGRGYMKNLQGPPEPERYRGRDFEFPILNPTPKMLCRKMLLSGELMLDRVPTPFKAVLTDVTSNPKLHGRPALLQVSTAGEIPVQLVVRHDATGDIAVTDLSADYMDPTEQQLSAGKQEGDLLTASIRNMQWKARFSLVEDQISGQIDVRSEFGEPQFRTTSPVATALAGVTQDTLSAISSVNATIQLEGSVLKPQVSMSSDLGEKFAAGFETAFATHLPVMKQQALSLVSKYAVEQKQQLAQKLGGRYGELLADHEKLMQNIDNVRTLAANLKAGQVDPNEVYRQVSQSGLLSEKDQQKTDKYMNKANRIDDVLKGKTDPTQVIQDALPGLRKKLFR